MKIDIYPVGWLDALLFLRGAYSARIPAEHQAQVRVHAWAKLRYQLSRNAEQIRLRQWRSLKNTLNGYLCEPTPFPASVRRCGSGWTKRRARRSLDRHLAAANPVVITPDQLDRAMVAYRRGARMTTWEECIEHDADRTLAGLRAALTEIGFTVQRRDTSPKPGGAT